MKTLRMIGEISQPKDLPEGWGNGLNAVERDQKLQAAPLAFSAYTVGDKHSYISGTNDRYKTLEDAVFAIQRRTWVQKVLVIETTNESRHEGWGGTWLVADATELGEPMVEPETAESNRHPADILQSAFYHVCAMPRFDSQNHQWLTPGHTAQEDFDSAHAVLNNAFGEIMHGAELRFQQHGRAPAADSRFD